MAKDDAPPPARPPVKRRALERAPDHWLAVWANDDTVPERDRERVEEVREQRRIARKTRFVAVGLLADREGLTPVQLTKLMELMKGYSPTHVHHPWVASPVASAIRKLGVPVTVYKDVRNDYAPLRDVVLASDAIVAAPRGIEQVHNRTAAWEAVHYAKHRKLLVKIVLPDGTTKGEE